MDDKEYWNKYYKKNFEPTPHSTFAEFILPYVENNKLLIELGCGNGRDSIFLSKKVNVIGIDQVNDEISYLNKKFKNEHIEFLADDFTNLINSTGYNKKVLSKNINYIYSRFTFHSINETKENNTLDWIESTLNKDGMFFLEARSIKDPMFKKGKNLSKNENFTTHYRRYMDLDEIIRKLESRNFEIIFKIEDKNLAIHKDDNPYVIRIIAKKL